MTSEKKTGSFIKGATVLTAAGILSRVLGLFFKVPLYRMYGSYGNGIFYNVTNIYNFLLMVSTVGIPVAISKMVSENLALKDYRATEDTLKVSLRTLLIVGGVSSALLLFGAQAIINMTGWPQDSFWSIIAIAPAPLIISVCCAYRGYYQGFQIMNPTAISQIIEQIVRVVLGLAICAYGIYVLGNIGIGVAGSVFGATAGGLAALALLLGVYPLFKYSERKVYNRAKKQPQRKTYKQLFIRLLYIAVPVTLTSSIVSLYSVIDSFIYVPRLALAGINTDVATTLIGDFGNAEILINIPLVISGNLAVAFMPSISESFALKEKTVLNEKINLAVQVLILVGLPSCVGLSVLSGGISQLLFPNSECGYFLLGYAYVTIFMMLSNTFQSILQGLDKFFVPLMTLLIGTIIRFVAAWILLAIPSINLYGIIYAGLLTFIFLTVSNYFFLKKYSQFKLNWMKVLGFIVSTALMAIGTLSIYRLFILFLPNVICVVLAIIAGVAFYATAIILTGSMSDELLDSLPGASKIRPLYNKINAHLNEE